MLSIATTSAPGDARRQEMTGDRRLADVAGEVNDGDFHGAILERKSGLVIRPATNAAAMSLLLRGSSAKARVALEGAAAISRAGRVDVGSASGERGRCRSA